MTSETQATSQINPWIKPFEYSKQWWIPDYSHVVCKTAGAAKRILKDLGKLLLNIGICGLNFAHRRWHSETSLWQDFKACIGQRLKNLFNRNSTPVEVKETHNTPRPQVHLSVSTQARSLFASHSDLNPFEFGTGDGNGFDAEIEEPSDPTSDTI